MKLIEQLKRKSESKSPTYSLLPTRTRLLVMTPQLSENTSKTRFKSPKSTLLGSTTEDKKSTERETNSEDRDVFQT